MQVNKNNVTQFLTATGISFTIPVYQRNYDWNEDNCKQLWNDIWYISKTASSRTHFLGTICSKSINGREKTIIDGQQRITTITLMMKAMHDYVDNEEFKKDIDSSFLHNTGYGTPESHKVKLHLNKRDDAIYNRLLEFDEFVQPEALNKQDAASSIYQNYAFFYRRMEGLAEPDIAEIRSSLDRLIIVDLDVENENPQEIFESLNSAGLDLTDVDLLRNYLLMSLDYETQVRLYNDYWYKIEENVNPKNMVRFFVDYLIFVRQSDAFQEKGRRAHINEGNLYSAFKEHCRIEAGSDERHSNSPETTESILSNMLSLSKDYKSLVFDEDRLDMNEMEQMDRIIYSTIYLNEAPSSRPVLLYVIKKLHDGEIGNNQAIEMLNACLSLTFRAKVTRSTGINGQFAGNVLQRLNAAMQDNPVDAFWRAITAGSGRFMFPPDNMFKDALVNRPIFDALRAKGTKYLLYTLGQHSCSAKGLPRYDDASTTIEHIMPKTLSGEWRNHLGFEVERYDDFLNKLGNLALTSYNSEMSNKPFAAKQEWYKDSSFYYTRNISSLASWSIEAIRQRSNTLADKCVEIWSIPEQYQPIAEISEATKRRPPFKFSMIGLVPGDEVAFVEDPSKVATILDDSHVEYGGERYSLSGLAAKLMRRSFPNGGVAGPLHFSYGGETLSELRDEIEANIY